MQFLRSALFLLGMVLATVVVAPVVMLSFFLPFEKRYAITQWWTRFNIWSLKTLCGVHYELIGEENVPTTATIVLSKHQSTWETFFLQQYLPPISWVLKRELLKIPLFGWSLALLDPIAIDRKSAKLAAKQVLEQGQQKLQQGHWVLLFPEGTRTAPGKRQRYRLGGARLAAHSGYPVLPVAHNAGEYWPRHSFIKYPGTIRVVFGPLIDSQGKTPEQINHEVEEWIESTMLRISTVAGENRPDMSPAG